MSGSDPSSAPAELLPADLSRHPGGRRVRKRPISVHVDFAVTEQMVETLEGPVPAHAGDAIVTGTEGERWPIGRARFDAKYEPLPPTRHGEPGRYSPRPLLVWALQMDVPFAVQTSKGGILQGHPGDWLLDYGDGSRGVVASEIFRVTYEPV